jgi:transcriptional regulator with XRE-family HTH domain
MPNDLGQRLLDFIIQNYGSIKEFAKVSGISDSTISRYINDKSSPGLDKLQTMTELGMSVDWWLSGNGNMYANNRAGQLLQKKNIEKDKASDGNDSPRKRALAWIFENYEDLENFCLIWNCNQSEVYNFLYNNHLPDPEIITVMENSGCNRYWLSTGSGSKFAENIPGSILRIKQDGKRNKNDKEIHELLKKHHKEDISYLSQKEILNFIRSLNDSDCNK